MGIVRANQGYDRTRPLLNGRRAIRESRPGGLEKVLPHPLLGGLGIKPVGLIDWPIDGGAKPKIDPQSSKRRFVACKTASRTRFRVWGYGKK
jgi:hypothetical protein